MIRQVMSNREMVFRRAVVFLARAPDPSSRMAGSQRHFPSLAIDISAREYEKQGDFKA